MGGRWVVGPRSGQLSPGGLTLVSSIWLEATGWVKRGPLGVSK